MSGRQRDNSASAAAFKDEFGIVYSAMLHRHCTYVECGSHIIKRRTVNCRTEPNDPAGEYAAT
jgi:hypothetical protein